jgi:hypothetical protein
VQIKPFGNEAYSEDEIKAAEESDVKMARRDFFIYDEERNIAPLFGIENNLLTGVIQVNKLLVRGLPCESGVSYDRERSERLTFVKSIYIYDAFMNSEIQNPEERFNNAVLKPLIGLVSAYTDTKQLVNIGINSPDYAEVANQYGISIYSFTNKSLMSVMCNPVLVKDGLIVGTSRFDITDPRYNSVKYFDRKHSTESLSLPTHYLGKDLVKKSNVKIAIYRSHFKDNDSFSEDNLLKTSKDFYTGKEIILKKNSFQQEGANEIAVLKTIKLIDKKRALRSLIIDITKASAYSLFESFTMTYETGKKSGFNVIKPPFKQYHVKFMDDKMTFVYTEFVRLCEKVTEMFGRVRITLHVNDVEHVVRCKFLGEIENSLKTVTLRMTKLECINDFIYESLHGNSQRQLNEFKAEHDLDLLNYYGYKENGQQYYFQGRF